MSYSTILNLNSKYRTADSLSSSNFNISIGQSINVKQAVLKTVIMPNAMYNITAMNNQFTFLQIVNHSIVIPIGQYSIGLLISTLQTAIQTIDVLATIVQDPVTYKLKFTFTVPTKIYVGVSYSTLPEFIGFNIPNFVGMYPVGSTSIIYAPNLPNLTGIREVFICSRTLAQGVNSLLQNGVNLPMILVMPNNVPFGSVNTYQSNDNMLDIKTYKQLQNIQYIDIQVRDGDNNIVDLNGENWSMTLILYYELTI